MNAELTCNLFQIVQIKTPWCNGGPWLLKRRVDGILGLLYSYIIFVGYYTFIDTVLMSM